MAKPYAGRSGSGFHIHASLADAAGKNLFASEDPEGTPLMRQAIAGLLATIADGMGVFAPNANSYRRFQASSYAPIARTWGINNRSVAIRVPTGAPASRHLEHRVAGADANPYLAIAAVLAGMHKGIREKLDPGDAVKGNGYAQGVADLPNDWPAALRAMKGSAFLKECFGERFLEIFHAIKAAECRRFSAQVSELNLEWYLGRG